MDAIPRNTIDNVFIPMNVEAACHESYVRDEIQKFSNLLPMYVSMEFPNNLDNTQDQHVAYNVTDCRIYLRAFAECLSDGDGILVQYIDAKFLRIRYDVLLWEYAKKKIEDGAVRENEAPPK
ncbi:hypothetical protein H5410_021722 [Solanum commersonii]|uniref:Uncharacterized protein n=1 Tax=Solanum commersonii TaxID=4109 RepID=A0A9J5ZC48_SOLCO|nr:hypothetical protein H5410_021722 [Solanum commersonii]